MNKNLFVTSFLLFANLFYFGCKSPKNSTLQILNENSQIQNHDVEAKPERVVSEKIDGKFVGCWSNGSGELIRIDKNKMFYGYPRKNPKDSPKPVNFVIEDSYTKDLVLLKLTNRPEFFRFQDYVTLHYAGVNEFEFKEMTEISYTSYEDFLNEKKSGFSTWVKDECNKWY